MVSLVIQWLQILQVQVRRVGYLFVAGVQLSVTVPPNPYLFHVGFFGSISLRWHSTSASMVGVNLFSLGVVILLMGLWSSRPPSSTRPTEQNRAPHP